MPENVSFSLLIVKSNYVFDSCNDSNSSLITKSVTQTMLVIAIVLIIPSFCFKNAAKSLIVFSFICFFLHREGEF